MSESFQLGERETGSSVPGNRDELLFGGLVVVPWSPEL